MKPNEPLTTEQVADWAHCSKWTVTRDARAGIITPLSTVNGYLFAPHEARRYAKWKQSSRATS